MRQTGDGLGRSPGGAVSAGVIAAVGGWRLAVGGRRSEVGGRRGFNCGGRSEGNGANADPASAVPDWVLIMAG